MKRFLIALLLTIVVFSLWLTSYVAAGYPVQPHLYVQMAPLWHVGLQILLLLAVWGTGICAVYWYWTWQSERKNFPQQPPQHAQK